MGHLGGVIFGGRSKRASTRNMFNFACAGKTLKLLDKRGMSGLD
jgi:hypothetical protein